MNVFYMYGKEMVCRTTNATLVPNKCDTIIIRNISFKVKNVVWHIDNGTWIEIQLEK